SGIKPMVLPSIKPNERNDSLYIIKEVNKILFSLHSSSYLFASISESYFNKDTLSYTIDPGEKIVWKNLSIRALPELERVKLGIRKNHNVNNQYSVAEIKKLENKFLTYYENNGYPFASLSFDSLQIENDGIFASLSIVRGPLILHDSVKILGTSKMKNPFVEKYLHMNKGTPFSFQRVVASERLLKQLPYVSYKKSPYIYYKNNKAKVYLFIDEKRANQADGVVGFLPNSGKNNSFLFTGEVNLLLRNLFGRGLNLKGEWRSFQSQSQSLAVDIFYPNTLGSTIDTDFGIDFLKQDSTFRTFQYQLKFSYQSGTYSRFSMFGGVKTSDLITTGLYKNATSLPQVSDFTYAFYGLGYVFNSLDDFYYPKAGWLLSLDGSLGAKSIRKNAGINELAYANVNLNSTQFTINVSLEKYTRIYKNLIFYGRIKGGKVNNENILKNDMYRFGGLKTLRGFNENDIFASEYALANLEIRQFTDPGSYLFLFFDQAYYTTATRDFFKQDFPFGFVEGASFTSSAVVFNFAYGLGLSSDQKISFNLSKIHFGYVSRF
ncbi:MAG: hypothetical protein K2Q22_13945, partial [Cytophagales bacterium]|nr:hypothetical protein [Cytophagales bacterium]